MQNDTTHWRVSPAAWVPISLAIVAESVSNALRAYGLGTHLDRFTVNIQGQPVSIAGAVLVLAAVAVSLSQARAAWVALTPSGPVRQRIVAGIAACLLFSISITAMASHILEAQRAKVSDEGGARGRYDRAKAAYDTAADELAKLGNPRPVPVIQAEVQSTKIDMSVWRRSQQCADISRDDTKTACEPILKLYKERGAAARKAELEPEVNRLRGELGKLDRPAEATASEDAVSGIWAWIMGLGVVFVATFGTVIFASVAQARTATAAADTRQTSFPALGGDPEGSGGPHRGRPLPAPVNENTPAVAKGQVIAWCREFEQRTGSPPSWSELREQFTLPKSTASVWRRQACG